MKKVVRKLVDKWSTAYLDGAQKGNFNAILKVSEFQYTGKGFGRIKYNPTQGRRWIEYAAVTTGTTRAKDAYRRLVVIEEQTRDKLDHLRRYSLHTGEHNYHQFNPTASDGLWRAKGHTYQFEVSRGPFSQKPKDLLEYEAVLAERAQRLAAKKNEAFITREMIDNAASPEERAKLEEMMAAQGGEFADPAFQEEGPSRQSRSKTVVDLDAMNPRQELEYLQLQNKIKGGFKANHLNETTLRTNLGQLPVAHDFPQLSTRFEINYAVKAALDGKMQRKVTDPIPRPIHEYIMVARTPVPEHVDVVSQSIHLAETLKDSFKPNLETALGGKTYRPEAITLADLPVVPTPVGTVRRYQDIVDDEYQLSKEVDGVQRHLAVDMLTIGMGEYVNSFWPTPNKSIGHNIRQYREAYMEAMDEQEFGKMRNLQVEDDHEHHGQIHTNRVNRHFNEIAQREKNELEQLPPDLMYDCSELTSDPDMALDNFRGINIGLEISRDPATKVDEGGVFPYNGLGKRSFFLSDPLALAKPWMVTNDSGSDCGEEPEPPNGYTTILEHQFTKMYQDAFAKTPDIKDLIPETAQVGEENHGIVEFSKKFLDPNPFSPRSRFTKNIIIDHRAQLEREAKMYSPRNYLTRKQFTHQYHDSVSKFDPTDQCWYINTDVLEVKKLPRTSDPNVRKQQVQTLVDNWMEIHQMQRKHEQDQILSNREIKNTQTRSLDRKLDAKTAQIRASIDGGRSTHADFALYTANKQADLMAKNEDVEYYNERAHQLVDVYNQKQKKEGKEAADQFIDNFDDTEDLSSDAEIEKARIARNEIPKKVIAEFQARNQKGKKVTESEDVNSESDFANKDWNQPDALSESGSGLSEDSGVDLSQLAGVPAGEFEAESSKTAQNQRDVQVQNSSDSEYLQSMKPTPLADEFDMEMSKQLHKERLEGIHDQDDVGPHNWIKPIDLIMKLADDGHYNGEDPLGNDLSAYRPRDLKKVAKRGYNMALHPADGSPIALNPSTRLRANVNKYRKLFDETFQDIDTAGFDPDTDNEEILAQEEAASEVAIREQLMAKFTALVDEFNETSESPKIEDASDDSDLYDTTVQPFIRPLITETSDYHPFWNRVIPNPAVFSPTPRNLRRVQREQRSYEESMWNQYGQDDSISFADVMGTKEAAQTEGRFQDTSRMASYHSDLDSSEIEYTRTYTRDQIDDKLESGRFVVARRKDINVIKPPTVTRM